MKKLNRTDVEKRVEYLEAQNAQKHSKESTIEITEDARKLLQECCDELHPTYAQYCKAIGDALALTPDGETECGADRGVIDVKVARLAINDLKH